ncbi:DUF6573 family protein [Brevibacillus halotolerans]|uniref:DUF6573 family protein n=1 Tax=Brevibacillus halotolerans TaxID=1507437 RepID=UPI0015EFB275|nr:DUF6573 family protein [Brevibacillus halotolerans]MBA4535193.1 hypothetical protein [Brevibacillus halotolerans]
MNKKSLNNLELNVIHRYTRKQALEDGLLIDVSSLAQERGFKIPVAITKQIWDSIITPDESAKRAGVDESGCLWDVIHMLFTAITTGINRVGKEYHNSQEILYSLYIYKNGESKSTTLKAVCSPGDNLEPVLTIMMPDED